MGDDIERTRVVSRKRGRSDQADGEASSSEVDDDLEDRPDEAEAAPRSPAAQGSEETNPRAHRRRASRDCTRRLRTRSRSKNSTEPVFSKKRGARGSTEDEPGDDELADDPYEDDQPQDELADDYDDGFEDDEDYEDSDDSDDSGGDDPNATRAVDMGAVRDRLRSVKDSAALEELSDRIPLPPIVGWAAATLLAVIVAMLLIFGGGVSEGDLNQFYADIEAKNYVDAQERLDDLGFSGELDAALRGHLERARQAATTQLRRKATRAYAKKNWSVALEAANKIDAIAPDAEIKFIIGESLRGLDRMKDAEAAYGAFIEAYPDDARLDDAYFWSGEAALSQANRDDAIDYFKKVVALPKSNFKRSATRRLKELDE